MRRFSSRGVRWIAVAALALGAGFGGATLLSAQDDLRAQLDLFGLILFHIQSDYVDPVDNGPLVEGAIQGMLETLDPHSVYLPKDRYAQFTDQFRDNYSGIGIQFEIRRGELIVIAPLEGTPAARLGIRAGDRIVAVDGKPISRTVNNNDVFKMLRGPEGSRVALQIRRPTQGSLLSFDVDRARIPQESVRYAHMIRPGVGYVRVVRFARATGEELDQALTNLRAQGMKSCLIDLRLNSGGLLAQAVEVCNMLVPAGQKIVYTRGRNPQADADYFADNNGDKFIDMPLVVLVDHGSASASEITAGAIQDLDRGLVVGTTSFGKGLVQNQMMLSDGSAMLLTVAKYYTPSGRLIQRDYTNRETYQTDPFKEDAAPESVLATRPKFTTAGGRTVYGGGGITPDEIVSSDKITAKEAELEQAAVFFETATRVAPPMKTRWSNFNDFLAKYQPDESALAALRQEAAKDSVTMTEADWKTELPYMQRRLKAEMAGNLFGVDARYRVDITGDKQLQKALGMFPEAQKLLAHVQPLEKGKTAKKTTDDESAAGRR
jgi:carboxyl-terminal processing protease